PETWNLEAPGALNELTPQAIEALIAIPRDQLLNNGKLDKDVMSKAFASLYPDSTRRAAAVDEAVSYIHAIRELDQAAQRSNRPYILVSGEDVSQNMFESQYRLTAAFSPRVKGFNAGRPVWKDQVLLVNDAGTKVDVSGMSMKDIEQ